MEPTTDEDESLLAEVRRLRSMMASAPSFILHVGLDRRLLYTNRVVPGLTMEDVVGAPIDTFIPEAYRSRVHRAIDAAMRTGELQTTETMGATGVDTLGLYLSRIQPVVADGVITSLIITTTDVTDVTDNRKRLQLALESTLMGIWSYEPASGQGAWDERTSLLFDIPSRGGPITDLRSRLHPHDLTLVDDGLRAAVKSGACNNVEHRIIRQDGSVRWIAASGLVVIGPDGKVEQIVGGVRDITDRRAMQARLQQSERLQSIGRLAGGIAHDFNNLLMTILGNVELSEPYVPPESELARHLDEVRLAAERSAALTSQLLAFARQQVVKPRAVDVNALTTRLMALLQRVLGEFVTLEVVLEARAGVEADPSQLEQVLLNLVTNARDAMPDGGTVTLHTSDVVLTDADVRDLPEGAPGDYVQIAVTDTGDGIPEQVLPHVFEPFYSTRECGTGLGLATSYGIVAQSGGHIAIDSSTTHTTFLVRLPARRPPVPTAEDQHAAPVDPGRGQSILLVEDDPMVRDILARALRRGGYTVHVAEAPAIALRAAASGGRFDIVVTDVILPEMDGRTLAAELQALLPGLPVLFISGYAADAFGSASRLAPDQHFLQKPFLPSQLLAAIRVALDSVP